MSLSRRHLLTSLTAVPALALASRGFAQGGTTLNVGGLYTVDGMNTDGSRYEGRVVLTQSGTTVMVNWIVGDQTYSGEGDLDGRVLTVNWGASKPVVYVHMGNELHGTWDGGRALERLVRAE